MVRIPYDMYKIAEFCRRYGVRKFAFFGSVIRDDFSAESDVDVLVEFEGKTPGLRFFGMDRELEQILGRKVDLNTPGFLGKRFRDEVLSSAEVVYDSSR